MSAPIQPHWIKRFLASNPFYLLSAALLLFGIYRVSVDPQFMKREIAQLVFNLSSLQSYALLVVFTAILLARRLVVYEATLLVVLDGVLAAVPFILISQAALIDLHSVGALCLLAGAIAILRIQSLARWIPDLNLPTMLRLSGLVLLVVNAGLPVVYRLLQEHKVGKAPTTGAAYFTNEFAWLLLLPLACALAGRVPLREGPSGFSLRSRWLPAGLLGLWLAGTGVHLYCLGYVYDFELRSVLLAPSIWVLAWIGSWRCAEIAPGTPPVIRGWLAGVPFAAAFLAVGEPGRRVFLALMGLNLVIYATSWMRERDNRVALLFVFLSVIALIGGLPEMGGPSPAYGFNRWKLVALGIGAILLLRAVLSRSARMGLVGAGVVAVLTCGLAGGLPERLHWAIQAGLVFFLLHSLRWSSGESNIARGLRAVAACVWVVHAAGWNHLSPNGWLTASTGWLVLGGWLVRGLATKGWTPKIVPGAALVVLLSDPGDRLFIWTCSASVGVLAVIASFLLFALGTLTALTKHRWNMSPPPGSGPSPLESPGGSSHTPA